MSWRLASIATRSFVPTEKQAAWVQPRFTCRITYDGETDAGYLLNLEWDRLLGELKINW